MASYHIGFEPWADTDKPRFPIGEIDVDSIASSPYGTSAEVEMTIPNALPHPKTYAERSVGVAKEGQLWFALECRTDAKGKVTCEGVLRGRHLDWFTDHGETGIGAMLEIRLSPAQLAGFGSEEALEDHGSHVDSLYASWSQRKGRTHFLLRIQHIDKTRRELFDFREGLDDWLKKQSWVHEPFEKTYTNDPKAPKPKPTPKPRPRPDKMDP